MTLLQSCALLTENGKNARSLWFLTRRRSISCDKGDSQRLQMRLGHATLEMVKKTLALANADRQKNHRIASPVDHWRL